MFRSKSLVAPVLILAATIVGCATGSDNGGGDPNGTGTTNTDSDGGGAAASSNSDSGGSSNASDGGGSTVDSGPPSSTDGGGGGGGGGSCSGYADPNTKADCIDTQYCGGSKPPCNPNGCDGTGASAYWCNLSTKKCVKKPSGC